MDWALEFYDKQNQWSGCYLDEVSDAHREKAALIAELAGPGVKRILELGAGGGQMAIAAAELGHTVVAVELVPSLAAHAQRVAASCDAHNVTVVTGDFYTVALDGPFDVVCYWDGFGLGSDGDQRRLLRRVAEWLTPTGSALIEIATPWYAASVDGRGWAVGEAERQYSFDADGCRWQDAWWPQGQPEEAVQQSIRCYSPADLRMLLAGTGLQLQSVKPGGTMDWAEGVWLPAVPLKQAMRYVAQLCPERP